MSSTQKTAIFMYADKPTTIQCTSKEKVLDIIERFLKKFEPDSKVIDFNFIYNGKKIESKEYKNYLEDTDFGKLDSFIISVKKNIKVIKCPTCNYGDCVVSLAHYMTIFYNCEHKHLVKSSYDNYYQDQIYFPERIICQESHPKDFDITGRFDPNFQLCLTCSNLINRTNSICNSCAKTHKEQGHFVIKYEDKNYYCQAHMKRMVKYCFECKMNLCEDCVKKHSSNYEKKSTHHIKNIDLLIPDENEITDLKNSLNEIKSHIDKLQIIVNNIIYTLNGAMRIFDNYYSIASNIMEKYESFNKGKDDFKNFTIFKCLRNLRFSNEQILKDLKSTIKEKDKLDKAKYLIEIYNKKKTDYYSKERPGEDLNNEDDKDWLKEVFEREERHNRIIKEQKDNPTYNLQK